MLQLPYISSGMLLSTQHLGPVQSLLHFDGANGSTEFRDEMGNTWTRTAATISTAQSKFGGASAAFNGTTSYLQCADANNLNFDCRFGRCALIEGFARSDSALGTPTIIDFRGSNNPGGSWLLYIDNPNRRILIYDGTAAANAMASANNAIPAASGSFWHWAVACDGATGTKIFVDGTSVASSSTFFLRPTDPTGVRIGINAGGIGAFSGHMDEIRMQRGLAVNMASVAVPTVAYADV